METLIGGTWQPAASGRAEADAPGGAQARTVTQADISAGAVAEGWSRKPRETELRAWSG